MANSDSAVMQELGELRSRVEWLDEERRKYMRRVAEVEQQLETTDRKWEQRQQRIDDLEKEIKQTKAQLSRSGQVDAALAHFRDEIVQMIEQYDQRRIAGQDEAERRQRVEQEMVARELAEIRRELPAIGRLDENMEKRVAEENRLAHLIGVIQNRLSTADNRVEELSREISYAAESERQNKAQLAEVQTSVHEINRRWEPINARIDSVGASTKRLESTVNRNAEQSEKLRTTVENWTEQVQLGEYQRNQRIEEWRRMFEGQDDVLEQFRREWVTFSDAFKEAKLALQTMSAWQKHMEDQQHELTEMTRIETSRMQSRWDDFLLENEKRWKNLEVDGEQRWASANRTHKELGEQIHELSEILDRMEQDGDLLWRVQTAQADALKQLPRIWLEEVNKAINQNPNRRRQPTLVPISDE